MADDILTLRLQDMAAAINLEIKRLDKRIDTVPSGGGAGVSDGDKGDIVVSGGGTVWNFDSAVVTTFGRALTGSADASAGRTALGLGTAATASSGSFAAESHTHIISEVTGLQAALDTKLLASAVSVFGLTLIDDADASSARTTLGLGTASTSATGDFAPIAHVGTGGAEHPIAGASAGFMSSADKTKLDGIATGATANSSDATLFDRANHTGTQTASTISDFTESAQDVTGAMVAAAGGSYDDVAGTIVLPGAADSREPLLLTDFTTTNAIQGDFIASGVGTGTSFTSSPVAGALGANLYGVMRFLSGTTANSGIAVMTSVDRFRIGGGERFDALIYTPPVFTTVTGRFGFFDSTTSTDPVDAAFFSFSTSGAIIGRNRNNNAQTATATIATLSASTWYHLRFDLDAGATEAVYTVYALDGSLLGTQTAVGNLPTAREAGWGSFMFSSGTSAIEVGHADRLKVSVPGRTVARGAA